MANCRAALAAGAHDPAGRLAFVLASRSRAPDGPGGVDVPATAPSRLDTARQELSAQTVRGQGGRVALERFSDRFDALLQELCEDAPRPSRDVAVFALGGYGRRHLCLHSDVDVLVLFDGPLGTADEQFLRGLLHPLWDLGLVVGHQIREVNDFSR